MDQSFSQQSFAKTQFHQQFHGPLFQYAGSNSLFHARSAVFFYNNGVDSTLLKQVRKD